jgi:peptidoglycan/xylan/chitin deacetylase (PgdA/CDA1 family)
VAERLACFSVDHLDEGTGRLLDVLERRGLITTCFVEGRHGEERPREVADLVRRGHELGMHGWAHEPWHELEVDRERELATRATAALERAAGVRPQGFRAPGGERTEYTAAILRALGYRYDASLGEGMQPGMLRPDLAQVPFVWSGVDGLYYLSDPPADPADVEKQWLDALAKVGENGGLFLTVCHGEITGASPDRLAAFDAVVARAQNDGFAIVTVGQVAEAVLAHQNGERR